MEDKKSVDESWKDKVANEHVESDGCCGAHSHEHGHEHCCGEGHDHLEEAEGELNFLNYVTSLAFQAMIFLGLIPNPMAGDKIDKNLRQAKFLIDTLILLREKTKGNLTAQEEELLSASVYELEMRYVEANEAEKRGKTDGGSPIIGV